MEHVDHILIVDDDREIRELVGNYLKKNGLRTSIVADGRQMRAFLEANSVDLIVLDIMMPGDDGLLLCRELRAGKHRNTPVLMLTARNDETDRIIGLEMGADDYLTKPFSARELLARVDVPQILRKLFRDLAAGQAVQPSQQLVEFPQGAGDFINYLGVLAEEGVYGIKTSPYIVREQGPLVTAWTLLMSMHTGQPLLLCDAGELTTARTAATTAVAVDALAPQQATRLAIIGSGKVAQAHLHYVRGLRDWQSISLYSPNLADDTETIALLKAIEPRLNIASSRETAVADADVIMLCTSSAGPVIDPAELSKPALITSISTNAPRAHEVPPHSLKDMQVFCDYRLTTPGSAGEMLIASEQHGWNPTAILGDLPDLISGKVQRPDYERHVFFRSIGLGLEDIALANALYRLHG